MYLRPNILKRMIAMDYDLIFISSIWFGSWMLIIEFFKEENPEALGIVLAILVYYLYEVILITKYRTVGQRALGFKCVNFKNGEKLTVGKATIRFIVKFLFGSISLLIVPFTKDNRAIHDFLSGSIVISEKEPYPPDDIR